MTSGQGHPKRWAILAVLVVSLLVVVLDNTVLNIALPTIQRDLAASQGALVWAIDSYILVFASLLFTWGVLGDRIGRKKVLIIGLIIFGLASAICAFSANVGMLIGFRAVMGIGGAAVLPTTLAIITVVFPPHERGKAIGAWALGPVLGGILLQHPQWSNWLTGNDWGSVFLINVPIVLIGVIAIIKVVPETKNPNARKLDFMGLLLSVTGLVALIYGIINASATRDWLSLEVVIPVLLGVAIISLFLWLEAHSEHASFDVSLFRNRGYAVSLAAATMGFFALSGITFTLPFYLQILRGYSVLTAGLCFVPFAVGQLIAAPRSAHTVQRFGYRAVMTTGLCLVAVSLVGMLTLRMDTPLWVLLGIFFLFGLGMGNVIAPASTVMQNVLPLERAGAGSAVQNTVRQVGGALGIAIIGTVLANSYASRLAPILSDSSLPTQAQEAASESVVATVDVLNSAVEQGMPTETASTLQSNAFEAFLGASHVTMIISLTIVVIAALLVAFLLPVIHAPQRGDLPPVDPDSGTTDDLVREEEAEYPEQLAEETRGDKPA
jgi:EmrB/QacA subfamily drug resistance transporter